MELRFSTCMSTADVTLEATGSVVGLCCTGGVVLNCWIAIRALQVGSVGLGSSTGEMTLDGAKNEGEIAGAG